METKKYWQAAAENGKAFLYCKAKPGFDGKTYIAKYNYSSDFLFPIPLKPLQIAEITVCSDGTWSYEIEREEGWYMAKRKINNIVSVVKYKDGKFYYYSDDLVSHDCFAISHNRIPDECII